MGGNVPNNVNTSKGIHYFRLKIENPRKLDMLWGISVKGRFIPPPSYSSKCVFGWQVYGQRVEGLKRTDDKSYNFMDSFTSLTLDMKLDCDSQKLSFVPVVLEPNANGRFIGTEY